MLSEFKELKIIHSYLMHWIASCIIKHIMTAKKGGPLTQQSGVSKAIPYWVFSLFWSLPSLGWLFNSMCGKSQRKDPCVGCPEITLNFCLLENQRWPREFLEKPLREDSKSHKKKKTKPKKRQEGSILSVIFSVRLEFNLSSSFITQSNTQCCAPS